MRVGKPPVGTIALNAFQKGNHVVIEIEDDGEGIDTGGASSPRRSARGLVSRGRGARDEPRGDPRTSSSCPGFTTKSDVSELSGRGVGMDVVKTNIGKLGGVIDITSEHRHRHEDHDHAADHARDHQRADASRWRAARSACRSRASRRRSCFDDAHGARPSRARGHDAARSDAAARASREALRARGLARRACGSTRRRPRRSLPRCAPVARPRATCIVASGRRPAPRLRRRPARRPAGHRHQGARPVAEEGARASPARPSSAISASASCSTRRRSSTRCSRARRRAASQVQLEGPRSPKPASDVRGDGGIP